MSVPHTRQKSSKYATRYAKTEKPAVGSTSYGFTCLMLLYTHGNWYTRCTRYSNYGTWPTGNGVWHLDKKGARQCAPTPHWDRADQASRFVIYTGPTPQDRGSGPGAGGWCERVSASQQPHPPQPHHGPASRVDVVVAE
eukprot:scaffold46210_cov71-Phaeocystis_antarctica.AAC.1